MAYAGFDRADCPDMMMMARLRRETNLVWCGFYLPAPSQRGSTWIGKREPLAKLGWGLAPIFVGQQTTGPGAKTVTAQQGLTDGLRAADALEKEGFPPGTWVYLDLENGPPLSFAEREYVGAWVDAVNAGHYRAGVYCSYLIAGEIAQARPAVRIWVFHLRVKAIIPHSVAGAIFDAPDPAKSGYPGASIWQHDDEARLTQFGMLACDLDSATMPDPGAPLLAAPSAPPVRPSPPPPPDTPTPSPSGPQTPTVSRGLLYLALGGAALVAALIALWMHFR